LLVSLARNIHKEQCVQSDDDNNSNNLNEIQTITISDNKFSFTEAEEKLIKEIISEMNIRNHVTPRKVKRILNLLNLSKQMCIALSDKREYNEKILFDNYIKWFFFSYFNPEIAFIIEEEIKYSKYEDYITVKEIYDSANIVKNKDIAQEKIIEEKIKLDNGDNKTINRKINRAIKETIKDEKQENEFIWLEKYIEEVTKSQLKTIKEVSRVFITSGKII